MLMLGDDVFGGNLGDVVNRQGEERADAAFLVEPTRRRASTVYATRTSTARWWQPSRSQTIR